MYPSKKLIITAIVLGISTAKDINKLVNVKVSIGLGDGIETDVEKSILSENADIEIDSNVLFDSVPELPAIIDVPTLIDIPDAVNASDIIDYVDVKLPLDNSDQDVTGKEETITINEVKDSIEDNKSNIDKLPDIIDIVEFVDVKVSLNDYREQLLNTTMRDTPEIITKPTVPSLVKRPDIIDADVEAAVSTTEPKETIKKDKPMVNIDDGKSTLNEDERRILSPCIIKGEAHKGSNLPAGYPIKELRTEATSCWKKCQEIAECEFWTWVADSYEGKNPEFWRGVCYLKRRQSETPTTITGFIAGTRACSPYV